MIMMYATNSPIDTGSIVYGLLCCFCYYSGRLYALSWHHRSKKLKNSVDDGRYFVIFRVYSQPTTQSEDSRMAKQKKVKKVEEAVNPIVFNCNYLTLKRAESVMGKHPNPIVMDTLKDKAKLYKFRRLRILPLTIHYYEKFKDAPGYVPVELGDVLGCPINPYLCDAYVYPSPSC